MRSQPHPHDGAQGLGALQTRGISVISLRDDVPLIEAGPGVVVRHLVGNSLLIRQVELEAEARFTLEDAGAEHAIWVLDGQVELRTGDRCGVLDRDSAVLLPAGSSGRLTAREGPARCHVTSSPPDVQLVRHLLHLEHADHGFD